VKHVGILTVDCVLKLGDLEVVVKIILKLALKMYGLTMWTGII
jgi:hypothetical protein